MDIVGWTFIQHFNNTKQLSLFVCICILIVFLFASPYWLEKDIDLNLAKATLIAVERNDSFILHQGVLRTPTTHQGLFHRKADVDHM